MCGRFTDMMTWAELHALYSILDDEDRGRNFPADYNICPTDEVPVCRLDSEGRRVLTMARWALVPYWAKEIKGPPLINARIESVATTPAYRDAFKSDRCLIPATGYYEWTKAADGGKDPHWIHMPGNAGFSFAGLFARNKVLGIESCAIITGPSEAPSRAIHDRMPLILAPADWDAWLARSTPADQLLQVLGRNLNGQTSFHRVNRQVNSNRWEGDSSAIAPV